MKRLWQISVGCVLLWGMCAMPLRANVLLTESFNYSVGADLLGQTNGTHTWTLSTKTDNADVATPSFSISSTGMSMTYYGSAAATHSLSMPQATLTNNKNRVLYTHFDTGTTVKTGSLYAAFLLRVNTASANARDFMAFEGSTGTTQRGRLFTKAVTGGYQLGITRAGTSPVYTGTLELGKTYLVVLKYTFVSGDCNDVAAVYTDFPLGMSETSSQVQAHAAVSTDMDAATTDPSGLKGLSLKLRAGGSDMLLGDLRIADNWSEAVNYTGPSVDPGDEPEPQPSAMLFEEGFDSNGAWTITGAGASTSKDNGLYGTTSRSIAFNKTADRDRCNDATMLSPAVTGAGVFRFWLTGSANETRGNVLVSKVIGSETTDLVYLEGPFGKTWTEYRVIINDTTPSLRIQLTVNGCGLDAGTLYIDDASLSRYVAGVPPTITNVQVTEPHPDNDHPLRVEAAVLPGEPTISIAEVELLWGYSANALTQRSSMSLVGENTYRSSALPSYKVGQSLYYRVVAYDTYYRSDSSAIFSQLIYAVDKGDSERPIVFSRRPVLLQLYPRAADNTASVAIEGRIRRAGVTSLTLLMHRDGVETERRVLPIGADSAFAEAFSIVAEPALYRFSYQMSDESTATVLADSVVAGDVIMIAGQSNGAAAGSGNPGVTNPYWRNFGCVQKTQTYLPQDTLWGLSNSAGWGYGRQFYNGWSGYIIQRNMLRDEQLPTAVINVAIGGSSLNQNLPNAEDHEDLNTFYGEGLYRMRKAGIADAVRAIIWVQGESDQNGLYDTYPARFDLLYQAWKQDYPNVERIYVSQINVGCGTSPHASEVREVLRRLGDNYADVTVLTNVGITIRYDSCHYVDDGYDRLYSQYTRLIRRDLYGRTFTVPVTSPAIQSVHWASAAHDAIFLNFNQPMVWPEPMWGRDMKDYFYDQNEQPIPMRRGYVDPSNNHRIILETEGAQSALTHLTYGPDNYVYSATRGMDTLYVDPWLRNEEGFAALTFDRYPIGSPTTTACEPIGDYGYLMVEGETLRFDSPAVVDSMTLYTPTGKQVRETQGHVLPMAALPHGLYVATIHLASGQVATGKLVY